MRILSLILLLCTLSFGALPSGTSYFVPIVVNRAKIGETVSNILYQIDLSSKLVSDTVFKGHITTAANVAVYDNDNGTLRPRRVVLDLTNNKLLIYWDGAASTTIDKKFYICVGSGVSQVNSASAFTNSNSTAFWGFNEFSAEATTLEYAANLITNVYTPSSVGNVGKFGNSAIVGVGDNIRSGSNQLISGSTNFTIDMVIKNSEYSTNQTLFVIPFNLIIGYNAGVLWVYFGNTANNYIHLSTSVLPIAGTYLSLRVVYNGLGATNGDRCQVFVNGQKPVQTSGGTIPSAFGTYNTYIGFGRSGAGGHNVDEVSLYANSRSQTENLSRYNMTFDTTFFSVEIGSIPASGGTSRWDAFKNAFKRAYK